MTSVTATHFKSDSSRADNLKRALLLTYITIGWMTIEGTASLLLGWASKSLLLEAFGIDSLIELFSGGVLLWRLRVETSGAATLEHVETVERRAARWVGYSLYALVVYVLFNSGYGIFVAKRITDTHESVWGILIGVVGEDRHAPSRGLQIESCRATEFACVARRRGRINRLRLSLDRVDRRTRGRA